jgi:hypothetical protein
VAGAPKAPAGQGAIGAAGASRGRRYGHEAAADGTTDRRADAATGTAARRGSSGVGRACVLELPPFPRPLLSAPVHLWPPLPPCALAHHILLSSLAKQWAPVVSPDARAAQHGEKVWRISGKLRHVWVIAFAGSGALWRHQDTQRRPVARLTTCFRTLLPTPNPAGPRRRAASMAPGSGETPRFTRTSVSSRFIGRQSECMAWSNRRLLRTLVTTPLACYHEQRWQRSAATLLSLPGLRDDSVG